MPHGIRWLPVAAALALPGLPAAAQGYDPFCTDTVASICNGLDAAACFDGTPSNWQRVSEYCVGDVQSMIEDAHAALSQGLEGDGYDAEYYDAPFANTPLQRDLNPAECRDVVINMCPGRIEDCLGFGSPVWTQLPQECVTVAEGMTDEPGQTSDGLADGNYDPGAPGQPLMAEAQSWGGNLRAGPGGNYPILGSLREGEPITVLSATNESFQGYPWFHVRTRRGDGYHWGGIICQHGAWIEGVSGEC